MKLSADLTPLLQLGQGRLHSCQSRVGQCQARMRPLDAELLAMQAQFDGLQGLLGNSLINGARLSHGELLAGLRRQAVVRRQMQMLVLEKARLRNELGELSAQLDTHRRQQRTLHAQLHKYRLVQTRLLRQQALRAQCLGEHEIEDLLRSPR